MIERAGYDLLRIGLRVAIQLWPLWLFWWAWNLSDAWWRDAVLLSRAHALLTGWPEYQRLWPAVGAPGVSPLAVLNAFDGARGFAIIAGLLAAFVGYCIATRVRPIGSRPGPSLLRGTSDNFGHADWLSMPRAQKLFPGPRLCPYHGVGRSGPDPECWL